MTVAPIDLTAHEALLHFAGWLTSRDEVMTLSGRHDAAPMAEAVHDFCAVNMLPEPRDGWELKAVRHPSSGPR